jgi:hypothetical protein
MTSRTHDFAILHGAAGAAPHDRPDGGNYLAGDQRKLQIEGARQGDQAGQPEIDGTVLDSRDMALRHARFGAEFTLAQSLAFAGCLQAGCNMLGRVGHVDMLFCIYIRL